MEQPTAINQYLKRTIWFLAALVVIYVGLQVVHSFTFHLVDTDPAASNIATVSPSLVLTFNRDLASKGATVTATPSIFTSIAVSGKTITLGLQTPTETSEQYTIHYRVTDSSGKLVTGQFSFVPKNTPYADLPKSQQQAILKQQVARPSSPANTLYTGTDDILNIGVTAGQLQAMEQDFYSFAQSQKQTFQTVAVTSGSVAAVPHDPNSASTDFAVSFTVVINGSLTYNAKLIYNGLTTAELVLSNPSSGAQVYDSGVSGVE